MMRIRVVMWTRSMHAYLHLHWLYIKCGLFQRFMDVTATLKFGDYINVSYLLII